MAPPPPPPRDPPPGPPPQRPDVPPSTSPAVHPTPRGAPPPPRGPPPPPRGPPPPPRGPPPPPRGAPPPPRGPPPSAPPPKPSGSPPPPAGAPPGPPPGPPPGAPPKDPSPPVGRSSGVPGPPPGAPPGPPKDPPPQPPKDPPPTKPAATEGGDAGPAIDEGSIAKLLRRGQLNIQLLEARNLRKKSGGKKFSADPYIKMVLGTNPLTQKEVKSKTLKKSASPVVFHDEVVSFDITDPAALLAKGDIALHLELYDENLLSDELLGQATLSALRILDGQAHRETLPLSLPTGDYAGEIDVEMKLDIAVVGMLSVALVEGRNLKSMELLGKQDPYCKLSIGSFTKRGKTVPKGGRNPYFGEEELLFWVTEDLWVNKMRVELFDEDIGSDDLIGDASFSVLHFMAQPPGVAKEHAIPLRNNGQSAGELVAKIEFFPAGVLSIHCIEAKQLRSVDVIGRQDPYAKFTLEGRSTKIVMKTKTDTDGGREPEWEDERFAFQVVDQYNILIEVWDEDSVGDDDLIGAATVSLLPIFRYGYIDDWLNLWFKGKFGSKEPAGQLHLEMSFEGPPGVAFPQHQAGMDRYTEKDRRTKESVLCGASLGDNSQSPPPAATIEALTTASTQKASAVSAATRAAPTEVNSNEFTEEEVLGAFKFIDLDKNAFIGAAELRHLLICMGELVTDEEVDEMVRLCDADGDGQVSFDEFRRMVIHPDPSSPEFALAKAEANDEAPEAAVDVKLIAKELAPEEKQQQTAIKEEKKRLMKRFVQDNNPSLNLLMRISHKFRQMHKDSLDFDDFCLLFEVEPTGEYRRLFSLYTPDAQSEEDADLREILLGVVNFMDGTDRSQRVKFCFDVFDDDHNGFITEGELVNILKANYMTTEAQVKKKAQTILKQADANGDGKMSLDEFHVIAKKFPNLLFPSFDAREGRMGVPG